MTVLSPDCADQFKHAACTGQAWNDDADCPAHCQCDCHQDLPTHMLDEQPQPDAPAQPQPEQVQMDPLEVALAILSGVDADALEVPVQIAYAQALSTTMLAIATRDTARLTMLGLQQAGVLQPASGLVVPR